jgi:hypothetical protein
MQFGAEATALPATTAWARPARRAPRRSRSCSAIRSILADRSALRRHSLHRGRRDGFGLRLTLRRPGREEIVPNVGRREPASANHAWGCGTSTAAPDSGTSTAITRCRLAAFALDSGNPPALRREADSVVALFRRRADERAAHAKLSAPMLLPAGMLMLVPPGCGA